ncbi:nuclear transport factor 2-like [Nymphaea colorata]|nr:nuclear transport factor 2-like [Nymphaea colorata]
MASQQAAAGSCPTAQVVGNAFVHQYYHILHQSPESVYRFYQDSSKLGRPDAQEAMSSITTMQAINEKILSMDYGEFRSEIKTVDAQDSLNGGVLVLVTGHLISKDNAKRSFTQSFFLAPQDKGGYYVLNDIFRYVEEVGRMEGIVDVVNAGTEAAHGAAPPPAEEPAPILENHVTEEAAQLCEEDLDVEEAYEHSEGERSGLEEEVVVEEVVDEIQSEPAAAADSTSSTLEEAPKKSYASILKLMKENASPSPVSGPSPVRPAAPTPERVVAPPPAPAPVAEVSARSSNAAESITSQEAEAADGHSIYIKGLPLNATPFQLEEEFKRFGPIKSGGVQVRSNKQQGFCFGFVEFEASSSVQSAIEASPITIGGRQAYVEEKRPSGSRVARGRFLSGRGGYRNDGPRGGRGNYGGGRGYGRGDFNSRAEFAGRGGRGGSSNRGGEGGYQRVEHAGNVGGRMNRSGSLGMNSSTKAVAPRVPAPA